jgi:hypothetical protein
MSSTRFPNDRGTTVTGSWQGRPWAADVWDADPAAGRGHTQVNVFDEDFGACRATHQAPAGCDPEEAARAVARGETGQATEEWTEWCERRASRAPTRSAPGVEFDEETRAAVRRWAAGRR